MKNKRKIKLSLKEENRVLRELAKYLFGLARTFNEFFDFYSQKIKNLEEKLQKTNGKRI